MATAVSRPPSGTSSSAPTSARLSKVGAKAAAVKRDSELRIPLNSETMAMKIK